MLRSALGSEGVHRCPGSCGHFMAGNLQIQIQKQFQAMCKANLQCLRQLKSAIAETLFGHIFSMPPAKHAGLTELKVAAKKNLNSRLQPLRCQACRRAWADWLQGLASTSAT